MLFPVSQGVGIDWRGFKNELGLKMRRLRLVFSYQGWEYTLSWAYPTTSSSTNEKSSENSRKQKRRSKSVRQAQGEKTAN